MRKEVSDFDPVIGTENGDPIFSNRTHGLHFCYGGREIVKMAKGKKAGAWGIDVGQCALKAMRLEVIDGQLTATAFDYVEYPKILNQPDADPDQLTREALETFLGRNNLQGDLVAVSVPGQSGLARFVKLPPVEEKKIADIVRFEAKQQIPFPSTR